MKIIRIEDENEEDDEDDEDAEEHWLY